MLWERVLRSARLEEVEEVEVEVLLGTGGWVVRAREDRRGDIVEGVGSIGEFLSRERLVSTMRVSN